MLGKIIATSSLAAALVLPGICSAQYTGGYAGVGVGQSRFKDACPRAPAAGCNDTDTSLRFFSGLQFGRMFAAEIGYVDLGRIVGGASSYDVNGLEIVGVAQWPFTSTFSGYVKAGGFRSATSSTAPGGHAKNTDWTYGLGLKMALSRNVGTRIEWQRFNDVGSSATGQTDVNLLSASLVIGF